MATDWPSGTHAAQSDNDGSLATARPSPLTLARPTYDPPVRYRRVDGVLHQVVDGRAMLIPPAGNEVLVLNGTGSAVWDALADGGDVDSLTLTLQGAHPTVEPDAIRGDVTKFLAELETAGLVVGE
jgi:hypothetical protein